MSRNDDPLEYLVKNMPKEKLEAELDFLRVDLTPPALASTGEAK